MGIKRPEYEVKKAIKTNQFIGTYQKTTYSTTNIINRA